MHSLPAGGEMTYQFEGASNLTEAVRVRPVDGGGAGAVLGYWKASGGWGIEPVSVLDLVEMPEPLTSWIRSCEGYFDGSTWVLSADGQNMRDLAGHLGLPCASSAEVDEWVRARVLAWVEARFPGRIDHERLPRGGVPSWIDLAVAANPERTRAELLAWIRAVGASSSASDAHWWLVVPDDYADHIPDRDVVRMVGLTPLPSRDVDQRGLVPWPDHSGGRLVHKNYESGEAWAQWRLDREGAAADDPRRKQAVAATFLWWNLSVVESIARLVCTWAEHEGQVLGSEPRILADFLERAVIECRNEVEDRRSPVPELPADIDGRVVALDAALRRMRDLEDQVARSRRLPVGSELDPILDGAVEVARAVRAISAHVRFRDELAVPTW